MRPRPSQRVRNVRYYAANRDREIERVTRRQAATTEFLRQLRDVPCGDCGRRFEGHQMDFDHRDPREKTFNLCSGRAALKSHEQLLEEAAKCDVVCANCHRVRSRRLHPRWLTERGPSIARSPNIEGHRARWRWHADLLDQLRDVPCSDCGGRFPPCSMDFDHRDPAAKVQGVTRMIGRASIERILAEVDKCDIVCGNCHRLRTHKQRPKAPERE